MEGYVQNAIEFLNMPQNKHLKEFVTTFNEPHGFAFSMSEQYTEIINGLDGDGHSGSSLALCMRKCQRLFNLEIKN